MSKQKILVTVSLVVFVGLFMLFTNGTLTEKNDGVQVTGNADLITENLEEINFKDLQGKVVFVNNWASWCPPCIAEMPDIQALKDKLKDEQIVFVMVSFDRQQEKAKAFMKKRSFDFDLYFPGSTYPYATNSIPATYILDKTGKVIFEQIGMANFDDENLVAELKRISRQ